MLQLSHVQIFQYILTDIGLKYRCSPMIVSIGQDLL
jgi:hypothetical protein